MHPIFFQPLLLLLNLSNSWLIHELQLLVFFQVRDILSILFVSLAGPIPLFSLCFADPSVFSSHSFGLGDIRFIRTLTLIHIIHPAIRSFMQGCRPQDDSEVGGRVKRLLEYVAL